MSTLSIFCYLFGDFNGTFQINFWSPTKWYRQEAWHAHSWSLLQRNLKFLWQKLTIGLLTRGGGPEKGPTHCGLGAINPKISSITQHTCNTFEAIYQGSGPVRSHLRTKNWVGQYFMAVIYGPKARGWNLGTLPYFRIVFRAPGKANFDIWVLPLDAAWKELPF